MNKIVLVVVPSGVGSEDMKATFRGHFSHTEAEFDALWKECVFSFDTNVLLDLYRYRKPSAEAFLDVLDRVREQLWLPHQVSVEFFRHRDEEIKKQFPVYDKVKGHLEGLTDNFRSVFPRHSSLPVEAYAGRLEKW